MTLKCNLHNERYSLFDTSDNCCSYFDHGFFHEFKPTPTVKSTSMKPITKQQSTIMPLTTKVPFINKPITIKPVKPTTTLKPLTSCYPVKPTTTLKALTSCYPVNPTTTLKPLISCYPVKQTTTKKPIITTTTKKPIITTTPKKPIITTTTKKPIITTTTKNPTDASCKDGTYRCEPNNKFVQVCQFGSWKQNGDNCSTKCQVIKGQPYCF